MKSDRFYLWLFETHADREWFPRWMQYDQSTEYGCPAYEFAIRFRADAIKDAQDYFEKRTDNAQRSWVKCYQQHIVDEISRLQGEGQEARNWIARNWIKDNS